MKLKISLMSMVLTGVMLASTVPAVMADNEDVVPVTLGNVESFEVNLYQSTFNTEWAVDGELAEYAKNTILERKVLPYDSPGQAVLHFNCSGFQCSRLNAKLTLGQDGPVLWKSSKASRLGLYNFERSRQKLAREIVKELEAAYRAAPEVYPGKIDIDAE